MINQTKFLKSFRGKHYIADSLFDRNVNIRKYCKSDLNIKKNKDLFQLKKSKGFQTNESIIIHM